MRISIVQFVLVTLVAVVAAFQVSCGGAARPTYDYQLEATPSIYRARPGDVLKVNAWNNAELTQTVTVRPDNAITLPLLGELRAGDRTADEIAVAIMDRSKRFFTEPLNVAVQVVEIKSYRIYVLGEVQRPGEYAPATEITVLQALSLGGGFTRFASPDKIIIVRRDARGLRRIPFVYTQVIDRGDLRENIVLQPSDTVVVP